MIRITKQSLINNILELGESVDKQKRNYILRKYSVTWYDYKGNTVNSIKRLKLEEIQNMRNELMML